MAGKSWREVGVESSSCNLKNSGDYPRGNKLFTLKTHKALSIHLKATKNLKASCMCGITPRPHTRSDLSARCFIAVVIATASACTRGWQQLVTTALICCVFHLIPQKSWQKQSSSVAGKEGVEVCPRFSGHRSYFNNTLKPIPTEPGRATLGYWGVSAELKILWDQREIISWLWNSPNWTAQTRKIRSVMQPSEKKKAKPHKK